MAKKQSQAERMRLTLEKNGKVYKCSYYVAHGMVTALAVGPDGALLENSAYLGDADASYRAQKILEEFIEGGRLG